MIGIFLQGYREQGDLILQAEVASVVQRRTALLRTWAFVLCISTLTACTSARMSDRQSDRLFREGRYEEAAERLKIGLEEQGEKGRDLLLYLLDVGLTLHSSGKYEESNKAFLKADKVAEIKDYTSLSQESLTLLTSDNIKDYKGEDFENVLISTYLAMNYALMGEVEDALVEARRVNQKLYRMVSEGKRKYKQNAFARYLSAILYESEKNYNDAYIDYKNTWKLNPTIPGLGRDLWRCAWQLRMPDEMEKWDQEFGMTSSDHEEAKQLGPKSKKAEIIVLYENGISPLKKPNPQFTQVPKFYSRFNPVRTAFVEVNGIQKGYTATLEDIEATAIENLDEKYGGIVAKKIAGIVAKEVVAHQLEKATDSPLLGFAARVFMYASDQADVRSWNLLPKELQILRIPMDAGTYTVTAHPVGAAALPQKVVQVEAGAKVFVNFRYMP